ncbi:MAG: class I SAM-dependent methyltransferase [Betaproteobacteria bacterium]|nr:class I SAM-dependent methyltransferase [Betaproteobacteria bacterium]MDH4322921.1 class I SAM-dependent methyltransferase [Betaproteobacteria bacterium]MDH5210052.1 class I SAM-dependent methyltransferase [Betaproteobacteria bacterium]MDH5579463.1 class I SAM-dependent methyltransferase [Betaproteobacteria bacterium]
MTPRMHSRELGLVLAQQLLAVDDLHYGLWDGSLELSLSNARVAQERYTDLLLSPLPPSEPGPVRVLDVGCGTGHLLARLHAAGYRADGVSPSPALTRLARERLARAAVRDARIFECRFEDLPAAALGNDYDVVLFSESFQYIELESALRLLPRLLKPAGLLVICDFFKTEHHGDGGPGDRTFGGGHPWRAYMERMRGAPFALERNEDITRQVSPNVELVNQLLEQRLRPATATLAEYFTGNYPKLSWLVGLLLRRRLAKLRRKYLAGHRTAATFERYKTYRFLVYRLSPAAATP